MINLSYNDFTRLVNYPAINKDSDGAFIAALLEAQRNYLLPLIGRELLAGLIEFTQLEVYNWGATTTSEVGRVYQYKGSYFKALTVVTTAPIIGVDWEASEMGYLYKEFVEPFIAYSIYYNLLMRSNVTLKGNNALRSNLNNEQGTDNADLNRNLSHYKDLRDSLSGYLTNQLRSLGWKIDGVQFESIGIANFIRCLNGGSRCDCLDNCRNINPIFQRRTFTII